MEKEELISSKLSFNLKQIKGMRNVLAHQYRNMDNNLVFETITTELVRDVKEFLEIIKKNTRTNT